MTNSKKLMVTVQRYISYSQLTVAEKIEIAKCTKDHELLCALATDKSSKVRQALVVRKAPIPTEILGDILLADSVEKIRLMATEKLMDKLHVNTNAQKDFNKILCFICAFFSPQFVTTLDTVEGRKKALAAIYLYYIKYGNIFSKAIFPLSFFISSSKLVASTYMHINGYNEHEPWDWDLWDSLERLFVYKYFPAKMKEILESEILTKKEIENINSLKNKLEIPDFSEKEDQQIVILADMLYTLGGTNLAFKAEIDYLCEKQASSSNNSLEYIIHAISILQKVYKTSVIPTSFKENNSQS